ncbi:MAG: protoporphyrinogen oxidase [Cytophagales bacterium]|nr:protoporphyrinogen oxidase [Cytophagales bacterium]
MVGIIGAGISGLSLAYELQKQEIPYVLFEASNKVGGVIHSERKDGNLLEYGPNTLLCSQEIEAFINEIGLSEELVLSNEVSKNRFIVKNGKVTSIPQHPLKLLLSNFFSWKTKIKIIKELRGKFPSSQEIEKETVHDFLERHFGNEIIEYLVNPFIGGIYAGNPKTLITSLAFPSLIENEKQYKSLLKGFAKNRGLDRKKVVSFKEGLQVLPNKIASQLKNLHLNTSIEKITKTENRYSLIDNKGNNSEVKQLVFACSPTTTSHLLQELSPNIAEQLTQLDMPPMSIIHSVYAKKDIGEKLLGFGTLHPKIENKFSAGTIWNSSVFENRTSKDNFLFTSFVGGNQYQENAQLDSEIIKKEVNKELQELYGIKGNPIKQYYTFYPRSIPQYDAQLYKFRQQQAEWEKEGIFITSNLLGGISVPDCILHAKKVANQFK